MYTEQQLDNAAEMVAIIEDHGSKTDAKIANKLYDDMYEGESNVAYAQLGQLFTPYFGLEASFNPRMED